MLERRDAWELSAEGTRHPVATTAARAGRRPSALHRVRRLGWPQPEWWVAAAAVGAWVWLAAAPHPHAGHRMAPDAPWIGAMVVAMMLPLTLPAVRHVARSSPGRRRHAGVAEFLAGYLAVWMLAMLALAAVVSAAASVTGWVAAGAGAAVAAALWEVAPARTRHLRRCERTVPLAPRGWRADADCARFGARTGVSCVGTCWALMAACVAVPHGLPLMAALFGVQLSARHLRQHSPALSSAVVLAVCAAALHGG
jgi:predicted metal-binding membrane protein